MRIAEGLGKDGGKVVFWRRLDRDASVFWSLGVLAPHSEARVVGGMPSLPSSSARDHQAVIITDNNAGEREDA